VAEHCSEKQKQKYMSCRHNCWSSWYLEFCF